MMILLLLSFYRKFMFVPLPKTEGQNAKVPNARTMYIHIHDILYIYLTIKVIYLILSYLSGIML